MRIFTVDRHPSSKNGGQEWSLLEECVGLAHRGHDVTLGYVVEGDFLERHRQAGVRTIRLRGVELEPASYSKSAVGYLLSAMTARRVDADVVCMNQYHDAMFGRGVAVGRGVPLVCHLRLMPPVEPCRQWRVGLAGVTRFIAVSNAVRQSWAESGLCEGRQIDVVHDGIEVGRFRPGPHRERLRRTLAVPDDAFVLAYAGRLDRGKNIDQMLAAAAALGLPSSRLRIWIAGRPVNHASPEAGAEYVASLQRLADTLGLSGQVAWLGARDDIPELLAAADAAALFSDEEPFGRATVEALACGTPIVANRAGATAEILTGEFARFAFDLAHPEEAVEKLRSCIGLRERDPGFAVRAHQHVVDNFSTSAMVEGIERSLLSVIADRAT